MLIDRDRQSLLSIFLADHVLIQKCFDLSGLWKRWTSSYGLGLLVISDDLITNVDALIADVDSRTCDEFLYFILRLAAEGTA
jgi:hypothetical protein